MAQHTIKYHHVAIKRHLLSQDEGGALGEHSQTYRLCPSGAGRFRTHILAYIFYFFYRQ
jgi:hypothetical protein